MKQNSSSVWSLGKFLLIFFAVYFLLCISFSYLAGDQLLFRQSSDTIPMPETSGNAIELLAGRIVEQEFSANIQRLEVISVKCGTYYRPNAGTILMELVDSETGEALMRESFDASMIAEGQSLSLRAESPIQNVSGKPLILRMNADSAPGSAAALMLTAQRGRDGCMLMIDGEAQPGALCFSADGTDYIWIGLHYHALTTGFGALLSLLIAIIWLRERAGRTSRLLNAAREIKKYRFLIRQLVGRDFKAKYKRSVLGMLWSFLNPLLMMSVQYYVFSTIFKSNIPNFAAYLIVGTVMYGFFSEACSLALSSILDNASLITKVYMPKYIYPLTRTMSSVINLSISIIPLLLVCLVTGVHFQKAAILSLFFFVCLILFCLGLGLLLSTSMVFFRDTQFLWGVVSLMWMYATPIFYPEEIIPEHMRAALLLNPLYHFLRAARLCLLDGRSPEPMVYALCLGIAVGTLLIGAGVFRRYQDRFVLYL